ncbi:unnamed protein product [Nesidiocoris tenuis]|uniref:Uncharacterized protein n=1 Tax=Nesidiocoris tenuis TaxID=355587 RepID=A0A6H5FVP0_9HEMI|nr:unnamed protein product [Nesidiocoris tenuis]
MSFWWIIGASRGDYWCSLLVGIAGSPTDRPPTTSGQEVRTIIGPSLWLGSEADAAGNRESLTSELRLPRQQIREDLRVLRLGPPTGVHYVDTRARETHTEQITNTKKRLHQHGGSRLFSGQMSDATNSCHFFLTATGASVRPGRLIAEKTDNNGPHLLYMHVFAGSNWVLCHFLVCFSNSYLTERGLHFMQCHIQRRGLRPTRICRSSRNHSKINQLRNIRPRLQRAKLSRRGNQF